MPDKFLKSNFASPLITGHAPAVSRNLAEFHDYWCRMRRGSTVPLRTDIDPRGVTSLLSNTFIAEKIAPGLARFRVAGTHLAGLMGMDVRGMPISALIEPSHRDRLADAVVDLFDKPAIVNIALTGKARFCRPGLRATLLLLPLRSDLGDVSRALGCLVASGPAGQTPRRFSIDAIGVNPVAPGARSTTVSCTCVGAPTEAPHTFSGPRKIKGSERPYLRLVKPV